MGKVNKHGLTINGLRKASGATENYGCYSGCYNEVFYDEITHDVWCVFQYSLGQNSWTEYDDPTIIKVCNTSAHMTMQEIADMIRDKLAEKYSADFRIG